MVNLSPIYYESFQLKLMDIKHSVLRPWHFGLLLWAGECAQQLGNGASHIATQ